MSMSSELESTTSRSHNGSDSSVYHQLTHSLVKPFKAEIDLKSFGIAFSDIKIKKYICEECLDEFIHESSFTTHLERKSVRISYLCDKCKTTLLFSNRCALLSHIRSHNQNQNKEQIDQKLSKAVIEPIELNHLFNKINSSDDHNSNNESQHKKTSRDVIHKTPAFESINCLKTGSYRRPFESKLNSKPKVFEINRNETKKTINTSNDSINTKYVIKKSTNSELKCTECKSSFNSLWTREQHLGDRQLLIPLNQCRICPTICATNCSQSFHNKLHSSREESGTVCPECGSKLNQNNSNEVLTHIIVNCLHLSRRLIYNCLFCSFKMTSLSHCVQHIISSHTRQQFQCSDCRFISQNEDLLKIHQTESHSVVSEGIVSMECPICQTIINSKNNYSIHLTSHRKKFSDSTSFLFICLECDESFATKYDLKSHFNCLHIKDKTEIEKTDYFKHLTHRIVVRFKLKFDLKLDKTSDKLRDQKTSHSKTNEIRISTEIGIDSNESLAKRLRKESENEIKSKPEEPSSHRSGQMPSNDNSFECCECGLNFPVVQTLKRHLILEHRIHDVESYINKTYVKISVVSNEIQLPKEVGEERLSQILDSKDSTDTLCPICSQKFSDSNELKIHGRVHGMAFIKSCQKKTL